MLLKELSERVEKHGTRSAWSKGIKLYAKDIIDEMIEHLGEDYDFVGSPADQKEALNGAQDWTEYSEGGCALSYNADIAERLCSPSELKRVKGGERDPNNREDWIGCQARALYQAYRLITRYAR